MIQSDQYFSGGWNHQLDIEQGKSMEHQNGWDNPRFSSIFHGEYTMLPPEFGAEHRHFLKITIFEALWIPILKTNQNLVNWKFRMIQAAGDLPQFSVKRQCERSFDAERLTSGYFWITWYLFCSTCCVTKDFSPYLVLNIQDWGTQCPLCSLVESHWHQ